MAAHSVPSHVSAARQTWLRHLRETYELTPSMWSLAILAAESYDRAQTARRLLQREGITVSAPILSKRGELIGHRVTAHPATTIVKDSISAYSRLLQQSGSTTKTWRRERPSRPAPQARRRGDAAAPVDADLLPIWTRQGPSGRRVTETLQRGRDRDRLIARAPLKFDHYLDLGDD